MRPIGRLHVIISDSLGDATWSRSRFDRPDLATMAINGGADTIQYRRKVGVIGEWVEEGMEIQRRCARSGVTLIINDHLELLRRLDADGIHLGHGDTPLALARERFPDKIIGGTARDLQDVERAATAGADYVGFGPVWKTSSKEITVEARGIDALRNVASADVLPIIAIGGVDRDRAAICRGVGAHGVAVIGAVAEAEDPEFAVRELFLASRSVQ